MNVPALQDRCREVDRKVRSAIPRSSFCSPLGRTAKLTGWPPISLPVNSDRIGHSGPATGSTSRNSHVRSTGITLICRPCQVAASCSPHHPQEGPRNGGGRIATTNQFPFGSPRTSFAQIRIANMNGIANAREIAASGEGRESLTALACSQPPVAYRAIQISPNPRRRQPMPPRKNRINSSRS